jgi:nitrite reductase/ring-hydroxylating ferredoxin subunit
MSEGGEHRVCALAEIPDAGAREFFIGAGDWPFRGFVLRLDGLVRAYANICPHKRYPLNLADDEFLVPGERLIRCASHGALFDPESGLCLYGPCAGRSLQALECRVAGGEVFVKGTVPI